jgi:hypothetical protein
MEWLGVIVSIPVTGSNHCTLHFWFGPAEIRDLERFRGEFRTAAASRGISISKLCILPIGLTPGEHDLQPIPENAGVFLDELLAESVELQDAITRGDVPLVDISHKLK